MRYWVFGDSRILGPYSREEMAGMEWVHSGTLVCQEGATGVADGDWRAIEGIPELAGLSLAAAAAGSYSGAPDSETLAHDDASAAAWPPAFDDDPRFNFWMHEEASATKSVELDNALTQMREQLARHERRQDEILDRLNAKDSVITERDKEIAELRARLTLFETGNIPVARQVPPAAAPAPKPAAKAPEARPPAAAPKAAEPAPIQVRKAPPPAEPVAGQPAKLEMESPLEAAGAEGDSPARAALRAARVGKGGLPSASGPMELAMPEFAEAPAPALEGLEFEPPAPAPAAAPEALGFGIPESESLSPVTEVPPPLEFAPPFPDTAGGVPSMDPPPPFLDPTEPPPPATFSDPAFAPTAQPQLPGQMATPQTVIYQGGMPAGLSLTPSPVPLMGPGGAPLPFGATPEPIPLGDPGSMSTPMPTMGQPDLPQTVMQGLGVAGQATPFPFGTQTPLPRLPGQEASAFDQPLSIPTRPPESSPGQPPQVPATGATKPSMVVRIKEAFRSKKFLIILAVSVIALAGIMALFLRNPKQLSKTVDMAPEQKAQGSFDVENGEAPGAPAPGARQASPFQPRPGGEAAAPPAQTPQAQLPPPAAPPAAPAPASRDFVSDRRIEAMEFVKNYKLDESRGTVGAWLQYSFLGPDTEPEWQAGAIEKDIWFVQYNVFKGARGGRGRKPTYSFRFEVDLANKTLAGANPSAKSMLNTGKPAAKGSAPAKTRSRRAAPSQAPLPDDSDLEGAGGADSGFNNPGG
ncbi:MAG: hypothetical protein HY928_09440 [Elusimicrobia bacterium]|nr:hypothetical protein [Elusimicrobiota bacterium]